MEKHSVWFKKGMRDAIPIGLGYFAVSFTFGMMAQTAGIPIFWATLISLTNVTSAGQFAALPIIAAQGSVAELALTQLVINLRYSLMSFSLSQKIEPKTGVPLRMAVSYGITDEIFGIASAQKGKVDPAYNLGAMLVAIPLWVAGTAVGGFAGAVLPDMVMSALNVAIYGMFLAIILPPAREDRAVLFVVLAAMGMSCLFYYVPVLSKISSGFSIIIITLVVSLTAAFLAPVKEEGGEKDAV